MALSAKQAGVKQVPWFSLAEWEEVYKQVYSNDAGEQTKAYEQLLAWKARIEKLPVGVDCTLSILQVCLRDREWTPKIASGELAISYEDDLCLMYSTTIMRFLNYIANIGQTKQASLFQIAKQLKIPEWIVNMRHDAAHGHELPSLDMLRIAINILLTWLHEEYWVPEANSMQQFYANIALKKADEKEETQAFSDLIELWTAVSLYIHAGHNLVSDISDPQLRDTLQDLRSFALSLCEENNEHENGSSENETEIPADDVKKDKKYKLETAKIILLSEMSRYLGRKTIPDKEKVVFEALLTVDALLPNEDVLSIFTQETDEEELKNDILPLGMISFWHDIIRMLHEKEMLDILIKKLLSIINAEDANKHKKQLASLWISSLCYSFVKLDAAHRVAQTIEYKLSKSNKKLSQKTLELKIKATTESVYPHLKNIPWMDLSFTIPSCLTDHDFVSELILNANEYYAKFIPVVLELSPSVNGEKKELLLNLVNIYASGKIISNENIDTFSEQTYTIEDIVKQNDAVSSKSKKECVPDSLVSQVRPAEKIRNPHWRLSPVDCNWGNCPVGILPWQMDTLKFLNPLSATLIEHDIAGLEPEIVPGIIDSNSLKKQSQIKWDDVLRKKKKLKRKYEKGHVDIIINRALETVKKRK